MPAYDQAILNLAFIAKGLKLSWEFLRLIHETLNAFLNVDKPRFCNIDDPRLLHYLIFVALLFSY